MKMEMSKTNNFTKNEENIATLYSPEQLEHLANKLFAEEKTRKRLDGWFIAKEIQQKSDLLNADKSAAMRTALALKEIAANLPLEISSNAVFAGTQRDAFARSYALINPTFEVETFSGYCDPTAVYNDIEPNQQFTAERIEKMREYQKKQPFVEALDQTYNKVEDYTSEVGFFVEQVTGHVIPDLRPLLAKGVLAAIDQLQTKIAIENDPRKLDNYQAMQVSLEAVLVLSRRYSELAKKQLAKLMEISSPNEKEKSDVSIINDKSLLNEELSDGTEIRIKQLQLIADTLDHIPAKGAENLYQAIQSFLLIWQIMCLEQAPNPFAFSVGNADRIFEPYRARTGLSRELAAGFLKHFLVFFNVGDRSWAISQNILVGGKDTDDKDLTNETTYALLDAYYSMNLPQPILSVKLHRNTPEDLYKSLGRFFFTPGTLTPSLFNDDSLFNVLKLAGREVQDIPDYAIAGCQEPLIMGKDNGNTTNSWLNLAKILELTINNGKSLLTGKNIGPENNYFTDKSMTDLEILTNIRQLFEQRLSFYVQKMAESANGATEALSLMPVPFLSTMMGGIESGYDMRDTKNQGTKYNGSGCLIHGLAVVADSFAAIDCLLAERPQDATRLIKALQNNFAEDEALRQYLSSCPKFGNNDTKADSEVVRLVNLVSDNVAKCNNSLGNSFRPDYATPSTHLLYGYWVGATPDGRKAREMLNYGTDPLAGDASNGLGFRMLSGFKLPYEKMPGGYASHFGIDPKYFREQDLEERGIAFYRRVIKPLFFNEHTDNDKSNNEVLVQNQADKAVQKNNENPNLAAPFYLYVNITTAEILRKVLAKPEKYAPGGVYIMRIHGTFVNFLDLSPAIQQDIIVRLDPQSSVIS